MLAVAVGLCGADTPPCLPMSILVFGNVAETAHGVDEAVGVAVVEERAARQVGIFFLRAGPSPVGDLCQAE